MGFRVETDVMVAMRDGVTLATDVWIPDGDEPNPALLVRLPYGKNSFPQWRTSRARPAWSKRGSAWSGRTAVACIGRTVISAVARDPADGADTIAWILSSRGATAKSGCTACRTSA